MAPEEELSFAYKYPFSSEAKSIVGSYGHPTDSDQERFMQIAKARLEDVFSGGKLEYKNMKYGRSDYVMGYVYARMLVSAMGSRLGINLYAAAEAVRSKQSLENGGPAEAIKLSKELGIKAYVDNGSFRVGFASFLNKMSDTRDFSLANYGIDKGDVILGAHEMAEMLKTAIAFEISKGLPIKASEIPHRVAVFAKSIKPPAIPVRTLPRKGTFMWIEKLLSTPIPDVRHRTVNLVLAPYLVNVRGMGEEEAAKLISSYIEKCKELDPNTKINDSYIKYQCTYAKKRGLKPLSLVRARELLGGLVDLGANER